MGMGMGMIRVIPHTSTLVTCSCYNSCVRPG